LISAIARLGRTLGRESDVEALVDRTDARTVLVLKFAIGGSSAKYVGIDIEKKRDDKFYLYRRDLAGRGAGLFLTGRMTRFDLRALQRNLILLERDARNKKAREPVEDFLRKKLDWLPRGGVISDRTLLSTLSQRNKAAIESLVKGFKSSLREIHDDFLKKIRTLEPEELLLTVKLVDGPQEYYIGELPEYVKLFRLAVTRAKESKATKQVLNAPACTVCNRASTTAKFSQPPLPFVTTDKPSFIPHGDQAQTYKVFPLCSNCFLDLRRGMKFIERHLDFLIPPIEGRRAEVRFWLIPVLDNPENAEVFIKDLGESATKVEAKESTRFLYLTNLRKMCRTMDAITILALKPLSFEAAEAYLTFTALFYHKDKQGHMRLMSKSEGIYPKRLEFIADVKRRVDSLYPFEKVSVRFGFPLLREFLAAPKSEGWYKDFASILGDIFTGESLNKTLLYKAVATKIQESARKEADSRKADLKMTANTSFKALSLIQYVEYLERSEIEEERLVGSQEAGQAEDSCCIEQVKNFLDSHSTLLRDGTLRAICATGIATGILLKVQRETRGSMPFWGRLNRLEMDLERVKQLFPQILNKLHEYDFHAYDDALAYLGSHEISNLDLSRKDLSKDLVTLVFAVGMSQGYLVVHEKGE